MLDIPPSFNNTLIKGKRQGIFSKNIQFEKSDINKVNEYSPMLKFVKANEFK